MTDPLSDTSLPADVNAEKSVLGTISPNNDLVEQAAASLEADGFYLHSHRQIFGAMVSLRESGNSIDVVTLPALLTQGYELGQVGGVTYLASLVDGVPQTDDIRYYCRIISYRARERATIALMNERVTRLMEGEEDFETVLGSGQAKIASRADAGNESRVLTGVYASLKELAEMLEVSERTIDDWVSEDRIPYHKVGIGTRFLISEIVQWTAGKWDDKRRLPAVRLRRFQKGGCNRIGAILWLLERSNRRRNDHRKGHRATHLSLL